MIPRRDGERGDDSHQSQSYSQSNNIQSSASNPEEGKMFIGGLNWETTEDSMRRYFEQFGPVVACTIMRDPVTGRSRGFGFLTFAEASSVNVVMVKEHHLDGKIIDPKRAIPRPDAGTVRNDKIFVRHVPPTMDFYKFKEYFSQFGGIVDSNLMMDRETGQHRGFGFVTYEDPGSVQTVLSQQHEWDGQELEVKIATVKRPNQDTYVGDRPLHRRQGYNNQGGMGGGGYNGGGGGNYGNSNGGGFGGGNNMMGGGNNMGMMGGGNGQAAGFDPFAMAQFFKQMGWGQFNPMMLMGAGMGGGAMDGSGMMGGMNPAMMMNMMAAGMAGMNNMGGGGNGSFSPNSGMGNNDQSFSQSSTANRPPPNAPTGPRGSGGSGPQRTQKPASGSSSHPYR